MPIFVKYTDNTEKRYNSFDEIDEKKEEFFYENVSELYCTWMYLKKLPPLPQNLQSLYCSNNQIEILDNLPQNLKELYCEDNKIKSLDNLPQNLQILNCYCNKITNLNNLPQNLQKLNCRNNQIEFLNNLPPNLQELRCHNNQIKRFDNSLLNCRNLTNFYYYNNPIEFTPQQLNFIQWIEQRNIQRNNGNYYNDTQNVHNSSLQKSLMKSIQNLMKKTNLL